jgi:DNA-binding transcriptional MerR regulator
VFTVGGFARLSGVSAKMLRAYDATGLFTPAWVDPSSGYRYYSPAQLPSLRRIQALRDVGISRTEIHDLIRADADLRATLERRRDELEAERRELDRRLAILDIRVTDPRGDRRFAGAVAGAGDVVVRSLPAELVATMDPALTGHDLAAAFHELEAHIRDLGVRAHRPPGTIPDDDLIFVPLRRPIRATDRVGVQRLPATRATTILHHGAYASLPAARAGLESWVAAAGYAVTGPLRILYLQFGAEADLRLPRGWTVDHDDAFVTELQLPIDPAPGSSTPVAAGRDEDQIAGQPA